MTFTTDENGYFKVSYTGRDNLDKFRVVAGGSEVLSVWNLPGREKDLGKVYSNPPIIRYYLRLEVNNSYSESDTITYSNGGAPLDGRPGRIKKAGPFTSGIIDTVHIGINPTVMPISFNSYTSGNFPLFWVGYCLNEYNPENEKQISIPMQYCIDEYQTVTLVID